MCQGDPLSPSPSLCYPSHTHPTIIPNAANGESLEASYTQLQSSNPMLALYVLNAPTETLKIFDEFAKNVVLELFEDYDNIHRDIHVRVTDLVSPDTLRSLRHIHLNTLVRVTGVVTRRTGVFPQLKYVKYDCGKCGITFGPFYQDTSNEIKIGACPDCQSHGPFHVNAEQVRLLLVPPANPGSFFLIPFFFFFRLQ